MIMAFMTSMWVKDDNGVHESDVGKRWLWRA